MTKQHVHLIGIGGSGLSAIATVLLERDYRVSGSDRQASVLLDRLQASGAQVFIGQRAENIAGADVVVRSSAVRADNPEVLAAQAAGIPVLKRSEFLEHLTAGQKTIAVAGTHGKTTTTAMIAWMLTRLGYDPSYVIGGLSVNLGGNAHAGQGDFFVIEADEYDRMFLGLEPFLAVITNIEHDHPDCYPTPEDFEQAFAAFAERVQAGGTLLFCGDDAGAARLAADMRRLGSKVRLLTYGLQADGCDYQGRDLQQGPAGGLAFDVLRRDGGVLARLSLQAPGRHNVLNALAALAVADLLDAPLEAAAQALGEFRGTGRRFEVRAELGGVTLVDDYAHHPTEIRATLAAARQRYPTARLWAVWQPHTYSRTRTLLDDFATAFGEAQRVVVTEIYAARETPAADGFSGRQLAQAIQDQSLDQQVDFAPDLRAAGDLLLDGLESGDVALVLSAGDADQIHTRLIEKLPDALMRRSAHMQSDFGPLSRRFGERLKYEAPLARHTAARLGGPAQALLEVESAEELAEAVQFCWQSGLSFVILGGGSNVLVSDRGMRGLVILNHARQVRFDEQSEPPLVWAESGANFGLLARQAAERGLAGLEWAAGIPGSLGGAVVGNAGAHGSDMTANLALAEILHHGGAGVVESVQWTAEQLGYAYRSSQLKQAGGVRPQDVVLAATLRLERSTAQAVQANLDEFVAYRRRTQPPGASLGSIFKNPAGDYAGRLVEAAGLKGVRIGDAQISPVHANFFINLGHASSADYVALIQLAQQTVVEKFGQNLELEIELLGEW